MNTEPKTKHKRYDEAFKKSAVEHWLISGKSARQVTTELVINVQNLPKWKQKFKELPPAGGYFGSLAGGEPSLAKGVAPGGAAAGYSKKPWA